MTSCHLMRSKTRQSFFQGRCSCAEQAKGTECLVWTSHAGAHPGSRRMGQGGVDEDDDDIDDDDDDSLCRTRASEQWWWRETRRRLQPEPTSKRCRMRILPSSIWTGVWYLVFGLFDIWDEVFGIWFSWLVLYFLFCRWLAKQTFGARSAKPGNLWLLLSMVPMILFLKLIFNFAIFIAAFNGGTNVSLS